MTAASSKPSNTNNANSNTLATSPSHPQYSQQHPQQKQPPGTQIRPSNRSDFAMKGKTPAVHGKTGTNTITRPKTGMTNRTLTTATVPKRPPLREATSVVDQQLQHQHQQAQQLTGQNVKTVSKQIASGSTGKLQHTSKDSTEVDIKKSVSDSQRSLEMIDDIQAFLKAKPNQLPAQPPQQLRQQRQEHQQQENLPPQHHQSELFQKVTAAGLTEVSSLHRNQVPKPPLQLLQQQQHQTKQKAPPPTIPQTQTQALATTTTHHNPNPTKSQQHTSTNIDEEILFTKARLLQWVYISAKAERKFKLMERDAEHQIFQAWQAVHRLRDSLCKLKREIHLRTRMHQDLKALKTQQESLSVIQDVSKHIEESYTVLARGLRDMVVRMELIGIKVRDPAELKRVLEGGVGVLEGALLDKRKLEEVSKKTHETRRLCCWHF
jgi:hypothetical protein